MPYVAGAGGEPTGCRVGARCAVTALYGGDARYGPRSVSIELVASADGSVSARLVRRQD